MRERRNRQECGIGEAGNAEAGRFWNRRGTGAEQSGQGSAGLEQGRDQGKKVTEKVTDGARYDTRQAIKLEIPHGLWGMWHKYGKDDGSLHGGKGVRQMRRSTAGEIPRRETGFWARSGGGATSGAG